MPFVAFSSDVDPHTSIVKSVFIAASPTTFDCRSISPTGLMLYVANIQQLINIVLYCIQCELMTDKIFYSKI